MRWLRCRRRGQRGRGHLWYSTENGQAAGGQRRAERVAEARGPARGERFEALGRLEQRGRAVATTGVRCHLGAQQLRVGATELVEGSGLRHAKQPPGRFRRPAWCLACAAASARCARRAGSGVSSAARSRKAAAAARPPRARAAQPALEFGGHAFVEPGCGVRTMPGAAIGIGVGVVASASARWTRRRLPTRPCGRPGPGQRSNNRICPPDSMSPAAAAGAAASALTPS